MTIAILAIGVNDGDFEIAFEPVMLEAIVRNNDFGAQVYGASRGGDPIRMHDHGTGTASCHQHGFIAGDRRVAVRRDLVRLRSDFATIAAADDDRIE